MAEILTEARRHPPEAEELPPLPTGQVAVGEVMDVLRIIANGSARPEVIFPIHGWKHLYHGIGEFRVGGWSIEAFKRNFGMKYDQEARAPDRRMGTSAGREIRRRAISAMPSSSASSARCRTI
jgi:hypothetical protein